MHNLDAAAPAVPCRDLCMSDYELAGGRWSDLDKLDQPALTSISRGSRVVE
jgi:hypothetical protein